VAGIALTVKERLRAEDFLQAGI